MSPQIKYAYKRHNTWIYRRTYPKPLQPILGTALKQSLKTGDATQAKARVAELNQTFATVVAEALDSMPRQGDALGSFPTETSSVLPTAAQAPRLGVTRPRYQRVRRAVSDLTLDKLILKEAASGNF